MNSISASQFKKKPIRRGEITWLKLKSVRTLRVAAPWRKVNLFAVLDAKRQRGRPNWYVNVAIPDAKATHSSLEIHLARHETLETGE